MFESMWGYCPVCGILHDDGTYIPDPETGEFYFVCMDCSDNMSDAEILQAIEQRRRKRGSGTGNS